MMLDKHNIKYIEHNRARLKAGKREESTKKTSTVLWCLEGKVKGMSGFVSLKDSQNQLS